METWKSLNGIVEYGDNYEISNFGRIRNMNGKMLKIKVNKNGYCEIVFTSNYKQKTYKLHRLVALAFIPNKENKPEVNHKDGNKLNCNVDNLEWSTRYENAIHAVNNGLLKMNGEDNPMSKLSEKDIIEIRELYKTGNYTLKELGNKFNVAFQTISSIVNHKKWKNID